MKTKSKHEFEFGIENINNSVPRVDISFLRSEIFVEQYQNTGTPVIITGLLKDECDWNLDYLCDKLGKQEFLLRFYGNQRYRQDKRQWENIGSGVKAQILPFTDYAAMLRNHKAHENDIYLAKCSLKNTNIAKSDVFNNIGEKLGLNQPVSDLNIWVGPGGHIECLHYDTLDGTLMQLHGSKKVLLFPPSQTYNLYPFPVYVHLLHGFKLRAWFSMVYPESPNYISFPKLKQALQHKQEVILERGELLYIPAHWWHEVTALGDEMVCSVNRFWRVYPTSRVVFSWSRWRVILADICAVPYLLLQLAITLFSRDRKQKLRQIKNLL